MKSRYNKYNPSSSSSEEDQVLVSHKSSSSLEDDPCCNSDISDSKRKHRHKNLHHHKEFNKRQKPGRSKFGSAMFNRPKNYDDERSEANSTSYVSSVNKSIRV